LERAKKEDLVASLRQTFAGNGSVVVAHQVGMTVAEVTSLRRRMRDAGAGFRVTKNTLAKIALEGTPFEGLSDLFTGPTAIAYSLDPIAAAKVAVEYANTNEKLKIVGGAVVGQILDPSGIKALATLPSIEELRARLIGMLQTPAARLVGVLQAPGAQVARVLSAYAQKSGEAA
jgi:large subunit ribosomal protein L10